MKPFDLQEFCLNPCSCGGWSQSNPDKIVVAQEVSS